VFAGTPRFAVLSACIALFAFMRALGGVSQLAVLCDLLETRRRSTAIALSNTANCFAGGIGVFIAGYLKEDFGLGGIFAGVSVITVVAAALLVVGYRYFLPKDMHQASGAGVEGVALPVEKTS
jgi:predicted MFS family arabinose efflux permease